MMAELGLAIAGLAGTVDFCIKLVPEPLSFVYTNGKLSRRNQMGKGPGSGVQRLSGS
jgi:hypothetical protein